jgi:hypothetical protein
MIFDPTHPKIDPSVFNECGWRVFYGDVKEAIPPKCTATAWKGSCDAILC